MLSSTRNFLRFLQHHNALKNNQIILKNINTRGYCQKISTISTQVVTVNNGSPSDVSEDLKKDVAIDLNNFTLTPEEETQMKQYNQIQETSVLEPTNKDVSHLKPILPATETFARYANHSESIQMLADLEMHLFKWEYHDKAMELIINLDKEQLKKYILFFHETIGIPLKDLGPMFSKCPFILGENLEKLKARVDYMKSKNFTDDAIVRIISSHPQWLEFRVEQLDERLGFFQRMFKLTGNEVRALCLQLPKVITKKRKYLMEVSFVVKEQMGFNPSEIKKLLLLQPRIWTQDATVLLKTFDFVHKEMDISHEQILKVPQILTTRLFRLETRHNFLKSLNKAQYNAKKEHYVGLSPLTEGDDSEFCSKVAKVTPETYNLYLKSL